MSAVLTAQAERFYEVFSELIRGFQFRDREGICCHGISVSACYTLDALKRDGALPMRQLARRMFLDVSTMTRVVDQLVAGELVQRTDDPDDRRVCRVSLTRKGRQLLRKIRSEIVREHEMVLRNVPATSREAVISALADLQRAFARRCCDQESSCRKQARA